MSLISYLSYEHAHSIEAKDLLVVDCYYHRGLNLAHVYNERVPEAYRSDSSTEAVLKWLERDPDHQIKFVTCNHWDIDGFLAVWSAMNPKLALQHKTLLITAAELGDFRTFDPASPIGSDALKLCALLNHIEKTHFCLPFDDLEDVTIEYQVAIQKFEYFLAQFEPWLTHLDRYEEYWHQEFTEVLSDLKFIKDGAVEILEENDVSVVITPRPLHYYALWSQTQGQSVATLLPSASYFEFEYKYESLVGKVNTKRLIRRDIQILADELTLIEQNKDVIWRFDNINEGGPILRPESFAYPITRALRYQNMGTRLAYPHRPHTSIGSDLFLKKLLPAICVEPGPYLKKMRII